jgi:hypothetical protein
MKTFRDLAWVLAAPAALTFATGSVAQPRTPAPSPTRTPAAAPTPAPAPAPARASTPTRAAAPAPAATPPRSGTAARAPARPAIPQPPPVAPAAVAGWSSLDDAQASAAATRVTDWIAASHDNGTLPYMVIDKNTASVLVYDAKGKLLGASPVLIGVAPGDDSSPGVGTKDLSKVGPAERTTPAGRFVARYGRAAGGESVLWVDWSTSVALHAVVTGNRSERRLERLLSPSPVDNRISFGCINVPTSFYREKIRPLFTRAGGVVYVLPDTKPLETVFPGVLIRQAARAAPAPATNRREKGL